jgi:hypothetical protein
MEIDLKRTPKANNKKRKKEEEESKKAAKKKELELSAAERALQLENSTLHSCSQCGIRLPYYSRLGLLIRHIETRHPEMETLISSLKMTQKEQQEETKRRSAKNKTAKRQLR